MLEKTKIDSKAYKYLINELGRHIKPSRILSGHKNFGEQIEDILKRTNRKAYHQIRSIEKLRKFKTELELNGKWESIKAYLRDDFIELKEKNGDFYPSLLEKELDLDISH